VQLIFTTNLNHAEKVAAHLEACQPRNKIESKKWKFLALTCRLIDVNIATLLESTDTDTGSPIFNLGPMLRLLEIISAKSRIIVGFIQSIVE
jgi:hypothetical protein